MAILSSQPGVRVQILANGNITPEYEDEEPEELNTTTKYIEAVSDANFEVLFAFSHPFPTQHGVHVIFYLDGVRVSSRTLRESDVLGAGGGEREYSCRRTYFRKDGQTFTQSFRFSKLVTDEDSGQSLGEQNARALALTGNIAVKFFFVKNIQEKVERENRVEKPPTYLHQFGSIPEKALKTKTLSHSISLGEPRPRSRFSHGYTFEYVGPWRAPFGTFNFKYRSLEALKSLYIVPRSPSPALRIDQSGSDLTKEALRGLVRPLQGREAAVREVNLKTELKREHPEDGDDDEIILISAKRRQVERRLPQEGDEIIELD